MGDDLAVCVELGHAIDLLCVSKRLQEEVVPNEQHDDGKRTEQEVPPAAHVRVAILAVAREEQVQAVCDAGCKCDSVAERILRIEVKRQALRRDDTHDEQHADNYGDDAANTFEVDFLFEQINPVQHQHAIWPDHHAAKSQSCAAGNVAIVPTRSR